MAFLSFFPTVFDLARRQRLIAPRTFLPGLGPRPDASVLMPGVPSAEAAPYPIVGKLSRGNYGSITIGASSTIGGP